MESAVTRRPLRHTSMPDSVLVSGVGTPSGVTSAAMVSSYGGEHSPLVADRLARLVRGLQRLGLYVIAAAIVVYSFFPVYWMVLSSVRAPQKLFLDTSLIHWPPDFSAYKALLQLTDYPSHFVNSLVVASVTVVFATAASRRKQ